MLQPPYDRKDVKANDLLAASQLAAKFQIKRCFKLIKTYSKCRTVEQLPLDFYSNDNLLVVDFGSNDLANIPIESVHEVELLAHRIHTWAINTGAKHVLILGIIPRSGGFYNGCNRDTFELNRISYNNIMRKMCRRSTNCSFRKIRGYEFYPNNDIKPTHSWSTDGIHPFDMTRYIRLLSHLMMLATVNK